MSSAYEVIIGLEVHCQLLTESKLFCGCSTRFGAPPNTQVCPVCIGMPGSLPVMNRKAFQLALKTAAALDCQIARFTKWDRKNYYYPDLPKGYQISQFDLPFSQGGYLAISDPKGAFAPKQVGLIRVHLEEDAGKSMHDEQAGQADSQIDLNRTGTPLLEIVSQPDMRSPAEAKAYLTELKLLLTYLGVSDCNMQEGSLRVDANINLHVTTAEGLVATPIVEVKNMNSFRAVERALAYEADRQWDVWRETGQRIGDVPKQTRGWDDAANVTRGQRHKEESSDYRYFPDPDLAPVTLSESEVAALQSEVGERPAELRARLETTYGITPYDSDVLVNQGIAFVDYFIRAADYSGDGQQAANWMQIVSRHLTKLAIDINKFEDVYADAEGLGEFIRKINEGSLNLSRGRIIFVNVIDKLNLTDTATSQAPKENPAVQRITQSASGEILSASGVKSVDESELKTLCRELLAANPKVVADIQAGKQQAVGALIGQAKKKNANADPGRVRQLLLDLIAQGA